VVRDTVRAKYLRYRGSSVLRKNRTCSSLSGSTNPFATLPMTVKAHSCAGATTLTQPCRSHYLSNIVNISPVPNSESLDRVFGWHSRAAATCARCCRKVHMACLMDGRSPRNLAYMQKMSQDDGADDG
jgi:hypothetical protein